MSAEPNYRRTKPGKSDTSVEPPPLRHGPVWNVDLNSNYDVVAGMKTSVPNSNGATGPASQIPGLSQSAEVVQVEKSKGRRVGIQATDSDYVKLAKQGGHKGLLSHDAEETSPTSGTAPNFFCGGEQSQAKGSSQKLVAPFGTDDCSAWDNDSAAGNGKKSAVGNVSQDMQNLSLSQKDIDEANKYKRM
ncbi:hypothetical protein Baya_15345 [Bagarius yarrelli]|uniref:Uncharacterized protein n=1 Tax=Bagarius yarrelli TaxID=175774 RepID=A0A556VBT6_BAGYA|nr:hypothetical protein Baya_15345 [Bagarius yarrelli]